MLPRVPREVRVAFVRKMVGVLVDYGLHDLEDPDYAVFSEELCEILRNREKKEALAFTKC
jgi:hypothetical protein